MDPVESEHPDEENDDVTHESYLNNHDEKSGTRKSRFQTIAYTKKAMESALDAVRSRLISVRAAGKKFGIPNSTLRKVNVILDLI